MGVRREPIKEVAHVFVQHAVIREQVRKLFELRRRRKLSVDEQVARFDERGLLGQLFDRVSTVEQDAFFAADEGDLLRMSMARSAYVPSTIGIS